MQCDVRGMILQKLHMSRGDMEYNPGSPDG